MKISRKTIEQLLEPLDFTIVNDDIWIIVKYNNYNVYLNNEAYYKTYELLFNALIKSEYFVYLSYSIHDWEYKDNPYFNCKSLEEMFIIRDLMLK